MLLCIFVIFTAAHNIHGERWKDSIDKIDPFYGLKPEPVRISIIAFKDFLILSHVIFLVWGVPDQSPFTQIFFIRFYTRSVGEQETILNTALWVNRYLFSHRSIKPSTSAAGKPVANLNQYGVFWTDICACKCARATVNWRMWILWVVMRSYQHVNPNIVCHKNKYGLKYPLAPREGEGGSVL